MTALLAAGSVLLAGCQNEEDPIAKAVLASASSLSFAAEGAQPQMIPVYSDAQWIADVPEWVTIEPATGSGTTDVNIEDGFFIITVSILLYDKLFTFCNSFFNVKNSFGDSAGSAFNCNCWFSNDINILYNGFYFPKNV